MFFQLTRPPFQLIYINSKLVSGANYLNKKMFLSLRRLRIWSKLSEPAMSVAPYISAKIFGWTNRIDSYPNGSPAIFWLSKQIQVNLNLLPPGNVTKTAWKTRKTTRIVIG